MRLRLKRACLLLAVAHHLPADPSAVSELHVKAAFCYHFAQFTEWPPASVTKKSFVACTTGHPAVAALQGAFEGKTLAGRAASVRDLPAERDVTECDLVFLPHGEQKRSAGLREAVSSRAVLTIGDWPGFAADGGMINFYTEEDKVRFEVNIAASRKAGLMINSQVLRLARIVGPKR